MRKTQFIYFDFDDTLIDVGAMHATAFKLTIDDADLAIKFNYRAVAGLDTESVFQSLGFDKNKSEELARIKRGHFRELSKQNEPKWVEGIPNLLDCLDKLGVKYGIVSSASGDRIQRTLNDLDSLSRFMFIISREDVRHTKPHPDPYSLAISKSKALINRSLVVEDSLNGYLSASTAGLEVWQLTVDVHENIFATKNGSPKELEEWIMTT